MVKYAILVAGGKGQRMNNTIPKQFLTLNEKPVLMHTLEAFQVASHDIKLVLVLERNVHDLWENLCKEHQFSIPHTLIAGGEQRFHSVKKGLAYILSIEKNLDEVLIAVHDGVRPLVSGELIERTFALAAESKTAVPALQSTESTRIKEEDGSSRTIPRDRVYLIQTPQVFNASVLKAAFSQEYDESFTDDASVVEKTGYRIHLVEGDIQNIKITYPADFALASYWLNLRGPSD